MYESVKKDILEKADELFFVVVDILVRDEYLDLTKISNELGIDIERAALIVDQLEEFGYTLGYKLNKCILGSEISVNSIIRRANLDERFFEMIDALRDCDRVSTSVIQQKFMVGFPRACKIFADLERYGILQDRKIVDSTSVVRNFMIEFEKNNELMDNVMRILTSMKYVSVAEIAYRLNESYMDIRELLKQIAGCGWLKGNKCLITYEEYLENKEDN